MAQRVFTKDTMLDLVVNLIPMGIMAFFIGLFVLWGPFSWDPLYSTLMLGIIGGSFVLLAVLTYVSAVAIRGDEISREDAAQEATDRAATTGESGSDADDQTDSPEETGGRGLETELETATATDGDPTRADTDGDPTRADTDDDADDADDTDDGEYSEVF